jgi:hypothetical protein
VREECWRRACSLGSSGVEFGIGRFAGAVDGKVIGISGDDQRSSVRHLESCEPLAGVPFDRVSVREFTQALSTTIIV